MQRMEKLFCGVFIFLLMTLSSVQAADYYVAEAGGNSTPFSTWGTAANNIADAVSLAAASADAVDTVWVSNGTYTISAEITVGDFTVRSFNNGALDRDGTIVKADFPTKTNRCFYLNNANAVVRGFTITNGCVSNADGGGVYISAGTLQNCLVTGNVSTNNGNGGGGGVYLAGADSLVTNCDVIGNATYGGSWGTGGGGVKIGQYASLWNSRIMYNVSPKYYTAGGGVFCALDTSVVNCSIISNMVARSYSYAQANVDGVGGGGVWAGGARITLRNCLIAGNGRGCWSAGSGVGATSGGSPTLENCTVLENYAAGIGSRAADTPSYKLLNTISYYNVGPDVTAGAGTLVSSNSCMSSTNSVTTGSGNITGAPAFMQRATGDFRQAPWSRGVDTGLVLPGMNSSTDLDGNPRLSVNGLADMGAYETTAGGPAATYYVAQEGQTPVSPYTNGWSAAASNIQDVVDIMMDGTTILVTNGTYTVTEEVPVAFVTIRSYNDGAVDPDGTIIKGGYPATSNRIFNLSHAEALVEGLTVTNGYMWSPSCYPSSTAPITNGAGVFMTAGMLKNCLVTGNTVYNGSGGGVYATGSGSMITNCRIIANAAVFNNGAEIGAGGGGGLRLANGAQVSDSIIMFNNCPKYCSAGGGIFCSGGAQVMNCSIISNRLGATYGFGTPNVEGWGGGGVWASGANAVILRNCLILGSPPGSYQDHGAGVGSYGGSADIQNCTIVRNFGTGMGAAIPSTYRVVNTISYYNDGAAMYPAGGTLLATNCCASVTNYITGGSGNFTNDPQFADYDAGDYRPILDSPCVDGGIDLSWTAEAVDLDGLPRDSGAAVDIGCYEYQIYGTIISIR